LKVLILGASRGLGRSLATFAPELLPELSHLDLAARNENNLAETKALVLKACSSAPVLEIKKIDLSRSEEVEHIGIQDFDLVIYAAGGGPYGEFSKFEWKDHLWALQLGLLSPMRLAHRWLQERKAPGKFVIVGSRVAENAPDPGAASYAAAKHGLLGFVGSLQSELDLVEGKHVWLFSPGYMDTAMLPRGARVRHDGTRIIPADAAAQALLRWVKTDGPWHRVLA
jgi:short-subunit dehydrogenase